MCFKPLTVPELEVYIVYWCQAFLTSRQGTLNKAKVPTYITCSFSLQEEWDRETLGFFLSLLDDRNGNLHFLLLAPRMSSLGCCCWDRTSIGRGRSFFPCSLGNCFLCLVWVCLCSPWLTPGGSWEMSQPSQLSWELFLAGSGAFQEGNDALCLLCAPTDTRALSKHRELWVKPCVCCGAFPPASPG